MLSLLERQQRSTARREESNDGEGLTDHDSILSALAPIQTPFFVVTDGWIGDGAAKERVPRTAMPAAIVAKECTGRRQLGTRERAGRTACEGLLEGNERKVGVWGERRDELVGFLGSEVSRVRRSICAVDWGPFLGTACSTVEGQWTTGPSK